MALENNNYSPYISLMTRETFVDEKKWWHPDIGATDWYACPCCTKLREIELATGRVVDEILVSKKRDVRRAIRKHLKSRTPPLGNNN